MQLTEERPAAAPATKPAMSDSRRRAGDLRAFLVAVSLANLCLLTAWFASLFDNDYGYFNRAPVSATILFAFFVNLAAFTCLFWIVGRCSRRNNVSRFIGDLLLVLACLIPLDFFRSTILHQPDRIIIQFIRSVPGVLALIAGAVLFVRWHRAVARQISRVLLILSPLVLFSVGRAALILVGIAPVKQDPVMTHSLAPLLPPANLPRVVWIIFDEFDYRFAFEERPGGLALPELDAFASGNFSATHAYPPGGATLVSIPSLLSRVQAVSAAPKSAGDLWLSVYSADRGKDTNAILRQVAWSDYPNVFGEARKLGANSAIVGWYHPYGRLFTNSISACTWVPLASFEPARAPSFLGTLGREVASMTGPLNLRCLHVRNYLECAGAATALVTNTQYDLVFLHMPVPHKPGISTLDGKLTRLGVAGTPGYMGNLRLADRALGELRQAMQSNGTWDKTWVIVSSDHWWRAQMANPGVIDYRIPFIVKAPKSRSEKYDKSFNTIVTHDLVLAIFRREILGGDELATWLNAHMVAPPELYASHPEPE